MDETLSMKRIYQILFWSLATIGRPFGGMRPTRVMHWLAHQAFPARQDGATNYRIKTYWGGWILGHPFYYLDREVIVHGAYDKPLHRYLEAKIRPGMTVFDVGANIGEVSLHMAYLTGETGRVFAFEPAPPLLERLKANIALNTFETIIEPVAIALSDKNGYSEFAFAQGDKENQDMGSLVNRSNSVVSEVLEVRTQTLDDFVQAHDVPAIDFIKVDIQGGEVAFLDGARASLERFRPDMVLEISASDLASIDKTPADLIDKVMGMGYTLYNFDERGVASQPIRRDQLKKTQLSSNVFCTYQ